MDTTPSQDAAADKAQRTAVKAHGSQAPPTDETIHTTANHPWLTADRGWTKRVTYARARQSSRWMAARARWHGCTRYLARRTCIT
jgi:hypothetical protein